MAVAAAEADERAHPARRVGDEADVAGQRLAGVASSPFGSGSVDGIDRRLRAGDHRRHVVSGRGLGGHVVEVAAQAGDERQVRPQPPLVLREQRDVAQAGVRHAHRVARHGGPSGIGAGSTTGAGPRGPSTTWPTSEVVVLVVRRSLLLSR